VAGLNQAVNCQISQKRLDRLQQQVILAIKGNINNKVGRNKMAKSRKKKNYKLRRRVMRTIAALTMIMAIVVAAIPVENYGMMRAAGEAWNSGSNEYAITDGDLLKVNRQNDSDLNGFPDTNERLIQEVSGGYLSTIARVNAQSTTAGDPAILTGFPSTTSSTSLDVRERMYYQYASYPKKTIDDWVVDLQGKSESFQLKYALVPAAERTWNGTTQKLPQKLDLDNGKFTPNSQSFNGTYNNIDIRTGSTSFTVAEIFTNSDAFFNNIYSGYVGRIRDYNSRVEELEQFTVTDTTTQDEWNDYVQRVGAVQQIYDDNFADNQSDAQLIITVDNELDFSNNSRFYLASFCDRVTYESSNGTNGTNVVSLKGFILESCYEINEITSGETKDIYVVRWNKPTRDDLQDRERYVDSNGYLANGYVTIVGVADKAFQNTQISNVTLPNSIKVIGDSAFEGSRLSELNFNPRSCTKIGDKAFYGCNNLRSINLTNSDAEGDDANQTSIQKIGAEAFYGTGITEIVFPDKLTEIHGGCFANSALKEADFSAVQGSIEIGKYAFYNCDLGDAESSGVTFPNSQRVTIDKAAFSVSYGTDNSMGTFSFPQNVVMDDYILAGRTNLSNVVFPGIVSDTIPENTFRNCEGLESLTLGELSYNGNRGSNVSYGGGDSSSIFADVENRSFHVEGPGFLSNGNKTESREKTLELKAGVNTTDPFYVPYMYLDADNATRKIEQKYDDDETGSDFIAEVEVTDEGAILTNYRGLSLEKGIKVVVPSNVAGYNVTALGEGCFKDVLEYMGELEIQNNTISTIGDGALKGATELTKVTIGNSVTTIGANAFADCPVLENVYFNEPLASWDVDWSELMSIAPEAFKTNSKKLTFHGVIKSGYAPFEYAMGGATANFTNQAPDRNICYQTDAPENLKVMRDNDTGFSTLVDYPHLEGSDVQNALTGGTLTEEQTQLLNAIFNITIPDGIQSIDTKAFFAAPKNKENEWCIDQALLEKYSGDGGLFSGNFVESRIGGLIDGSITQRPAFLKSGDYKEDVPAGNDHLTSITLGNTVTNLPEEYAFDSCENLVNVSLGSRVNNLGKLPFRGCKSLSEINFPEGNDTFSSQNMILYRNNGDVENPIYEIYECFEGRGGDIVGGSPIVGVAEGDLIDNITSIADEAFSNCEYLQEVNLSGTKVERIPLGCFDGCKKLNSVTLPDSAGEIQDKAFTNLGDTLFKVYIPNKRCTIASGAFDGDTTTMIYGKMYENETTGEESACYKSYKQVIDALVREKGYDREHWENIVQFVDEGNEYIQTFVDKDLETIEICKINPKSPDNDRDPKDALVARDIPVAPEYTGLEFVGWMCRIDAQNDDGYEVLTGMNPGDPAFTDIKEDRIFIPNYRFNPSKVVSCGEQHQLNVVGAEYILRTETGEMIRNFNAPINLDCAESITLMADTKNSTGRFLCWTVTCTNDEGDFTYLLTNASGEMTGFQMPHLENPDSVVTITAVYSDSALRCEVEVVNGSGSGFYNGGDSVEVSAFSPTNPRQTFGTWTSDNPRVSFVNAESATTTFVMPQLQPGQKVVVTASYKDFDPTEGDCELEVINGSGSGFYHVGEAVTISAYASTAEDEVFDTWTTTSTQAGFANASRATTTIIMPQLQAGEKITVTATYKKAETGGNGQNPDGTYTVIVNNGTGGGNYQPGATVTITANTAPTGQTFTNWTTSTTGVTLADANSNSTTFVMPSSSVTVTANYSGGSSTTTKYKATVNYGSGTGEYEAGATVNITANAPESSNRVFSRWTTSNSGLGFANANAVSTSFVMPAADVTVTANYRTRSSDDDDDDGPSRRPGTNTSTTTVDNRPGNSTSTPGTGTTGTVNNPSNGTGNTTNNNNNNNGNRIYITKNGISNTDVASLAVNGSTDNFIVRITESPEATAAVEQALNNTYGSLNGLAYLPMDISLYDSTGQNKITDTTGLNITVTMPIPDVLIQYGGNARVAAADNGVLQQITPRFTTIDGIACVSFVPPHFSPYVIYVDTNNLIAGQMLDATPATGDPIHPKWFAAIGMACVSILLFVLSDGRKRRKYTAA